MARWISNSLEKLETLRRSRPVAAFAICRASGRLYGKGYWRKMKGTARIRLRSGQVRLAELHWYEAHGIGKKEFKRKRYLD